MKSETLQAPAPLTLSVSPRTALNLQDRCDTCQAQAFVAVTLTKGGELLFCNHHYRKNEAKLIPLSSHILDESYKINAKPSAPADDEQ